MDDKGCRKTPSFRIKQHPLEDAGMWSYIYIYTYIYISTPKLSMQKSKYTNLYRSITNQKMVWYINQTITSWWLQPIWKIFVKMGIFPKYGWNQKIFETTTQIRTRYLYDQIIAHQVLPLPSPYRGWPPDFRGSKGGSNWWWSPRPIPPKKRKKEIHPRNLTWNLKIMVSKWTFLFQGRIFRSHVKFRGCICLKIPKLQNVQNMSHIYYSELILDQPDTNKQ